MRVAILSLYSGKHLRGVESWALNLSKRLKFVEVLSGNGCNNPLNWFPYDTIISTNGRMQSLICRMFCWVTNKKMIVFGHSGPGADDKWNLFCLPDVFVCFSSPQLKWANKFKLFHTKLKLIPHAVDTTVFHPDKKPLSPTILCVAANHPSKRTSLIVEAMKLIPNLKLRIVGDGHGEQYSYDKMPEIYRNAAVFCFTPLPTEAFGLVILEALATNLPVVTSDDPIRREIVGPAGVFVKNPQNPQELAVAIQKTYSQDWSDIPRMQVMKYSWDKIIHQYADLFI